MSSSVTIGEMGKWRSFLWPIKSRELKVFLPLFLMYALICLNYSILRIIKDSIMLTAPGSGSEVLPFLKLGWILPMAFVSTFVFNRLASKYSLEKVFYWLMSGFLVFFVLFITILYPLQDILHPHAFAEWLTPQVPKGFGGLIASVRNWTFSLFYVMAELWSTTIMTVFFWGFANHIIPVGDAKRYYGILGVGANLATMASGVFPILIANYHLDLSFYFGSDVHAQEIANIIMIVVLSGLACIGIFRWYHKKVLIEGHLPHSPQTVEEAKANKKKPKLTIRESFAFLGRSKYLIGITVIVLVYNLSMHMVETIWKGEVKQLCDNYTEYSEYTGKVTTIMAFIATIVGFFFTGTLIRRFGWTVSALIHPLIILVTGTLFFSTLLVKDTSVGFMAAAAGFSPLSLAVFFGSSHQCLTRASKYTLFDTTKEIAFIPLSRDCKLKSKAAIDGVASRLGKSGGAVLYIILINIFGSVAASTPAVSVLLLIAMAGYFYYVVSVGKQFKNLTEHNETLNIPDDPQTETRPASLPKKEVLV